MIAPRHRSTGCSGQDVGVADVAFLDAFVEVRLTPWEKVGALRGDFAVPRSAVRRVRVTDRPFSELRGFRAPGTGFPGLIALGTFRGRRRKPDFYAVYRGRPALVIDLDPETAAFERLVLSTAAPDRIAEAIATATG